MVFCHIQIAPGRQKVAENPLIGGSWKDEDAVLEDAKSRRLATMKSLRDDWERSTDRKIQANAIRTKVHSILAESELALEARRARFHSLYSMLFIVHLTLSK